MSANSNQGDGWIKCTCGNTHWGLFGAAGLLLARFHEDKMQVLLQHRAAWTDGGATWAIPGGALDADETPQEGALRETAEEAGIDTTAVRIMSSSVVDHGNWAYTTVIAFATDDLTVGIDAESIAMEWVNVDEVSSLNLLPAFRSAWKSLSAQITNELVNA